MKTNVSRKTINTYIYLKKLVINNKSADRQVHMMKASNNKNLFQNLLWFLYIFWFTEMKGLGMVKCESLRITDVPNNDHTEKSVNFPVTLAVGIFV